MCRQLKPIVGPIKMSYDVQQKKIWRKTKRSMRASPSRRNEIKHMLFELKCQLVRMRAIVSPERSKPQRKTRKREICFDSK